AIPKLRFTRTAFCNSFVIPLIDKPRPVLSAAEPNTSARVLASLEQLSIVSPVKDGVNDSERGRLATIIIGDLAEGWPYRTRHTVSQLGHSAHRLGIARLLLAAGHSPVRAEESQRDRNVSARPAE